MPKVILTADVKNGAKWEKAFRTRGDLFKQEGLNKIKFKVEKNHVVMCTDVVPRRKRRHTWTPGTSQGLFRAVAPYQWEAQHLIGPATL